MRGGASQPGWSVATLGGEIPFQEGICQIVRERVLFHTETNGLSSYVPDLLSISFDSTQGPHLDQGLFERCFLSGAPLLVRGGFSCPTSSTWCFSVGFVGDPLQVRGVFSCPTYLKWDPGEAKKPLEEKTFKKRSFASLRFASLRFTSLHFAPNLSSRGLFFFKRCRGV